MAGLLLRRIWSRRTLGIGMPRSRRTGLVQRRGTVSTIRSSLTAHDFAMRPIRKALTRFTG